MKNTKGIISSSRFVKLFSVVEVVTSDGICCKFFYTSIKKRIVSIETVDNLIYNTPFKEGDKIDLVFEWISNSADVELKKITIKK